MISKNIIFHDYSSTSSINPIFLLNKNKKLWVGKRINSSSQFWQMPQGGIDFGEKEDDAMKRELKEEVGTNNVKILMK